MTQNNIKAIRKTAGITQEELAKRLCVNRATISKYETGEISLSVEMASKIAAELNVSLSELMGTNPLVDSPENRAACDRATEVVLSMQGREFRKATNIEQYFSNIYQFKSDKDRIAFLWNELNSNGMLMASRCFLEHLKPEDTEKVVTYMEELVKNPKYQYDHSLEEDETQK